MSSRETYVRAFAKLDEFRGPDGFFGSRRSPKTKRWAGAEADANP
jgi:hypothetical protein